MSAAAELQRSARLARSYWLEYLADFVLYTAGFLLLLLIFRAASGTYGPEGYLSTLIGYITWKIGARGLVEIARIASEESRTGTLEQLFLTGGGLGWVFFSRGASILTNHAVRGLVLGWVLAAILGLGQPVSLTAVVIFLLTLMGAGGLGFALAGLVLVYKRLEGFLGLIWQMLVFFTGALAPIQHPVLGPIARALPLTWGIEALRGALIEGADLVSLWERGALAGLLVNTTVYLALGLALFRWGQRRARALGALGHY